MKFFMLALLTFSVSHVVHTMEKKDLRAFLREVYQKNGDLTDMDTIGKNNLDYITGIEKARYNILLGIGLLPLDKRAILISEYNDIITSQSATNFDLIATSPEERIIELMRAQSNIAQQNQTLQGKYTALESKALDWLKLEWK